MKDLGGRRILKLAISNYWKKLVKINRKGVIVYEETNERKKRTGLAAVGSDDSHADADGWVCSR